MRFLDSSWLLVLIGFVALSAFAGDIVADSIADALGEHCVSQTSAPSSQQEKEPCSHCSCAVHNGSIVASTNAVDAAAALAVLLFRLDFDAPMPPGMPKAIDHPPQLA